VRKKTPNKEQELEGVTAPGALTEAEKTPSGIEGKIGFNLGVTELIQIIATVTALTALLHQVQF
jgi:hypothetical protein